MINIAVLGCGRIGQMHAANIAAHPRAQLISVYDVHEPSAKSVAAAHQVEQAANPDAIFLPLALMPYWSLPRLKLTPIISRWPLRRASRSCAKSQLI